MKISYYFDTYRPVSAIYSSVVQRFYIRRLEMMNCIRSRRLHFGISYDDASERGLGEWFIFAIFLIGRSRDELDDPGFL